MKQRCSWSQRCLSTGASEESVTIILAVLPLSRSLSSSNSITATESSYHHNQSLMQPAAPAQTCFFNRGDTETLCKPQGAHLRRASVQFLAYEAQFVLFGLRELATERVQPLVKPTVPPGILTYHHLFPFSSSRTGLLFQTFPLMHESS